MKIGYARVSTADQSLETQLAALGAAGCDKLYSEKESGGSTVSRGELEKALDQLREGDELLVTRLDRLARSVPDLYAILQRIQKAGAGLLCVQQAGVDTTSPTGKLLLGMLGVIAEFERDLIKERQRDGIAQAKVRGVYRGRKATIDPAKVIETFRRTGSGTATAKEIGCGRQRIYKILAKHAPGLVEELRNAAPAGGV